MSDMTNRESASELYLHYLITANWVVLTASFLIGYFALSAFFPHVVMVTLIGIAIGNCYVMLKQLKRNNE